MTVAASVKKLFSTEKIPYRVFSHERTSSLEQAIVLSGVDKAKVLRTEVLGDNLGIVLAVVPLEKKINFTKLKKQLQRNLIVLADSNINRIFADCEAGTQPPFGEPYNLQVLLDNSLTEFDIVYFKAGSQTSFIQVTIDDFLYLHMKSQRLSFVSEEKFCKKVYQTTANEITEEYEQALTSCPLPDLSQAASKFLRFIKQESHEVEELINVIANHEVIHEQILNYAKLPFLAGENKINTMHDAINTALGFERVSHIALSVAASRGFNVDKDQSIYVKDFWRHTLYCATLAERFTRHIEKQYSVDPSISYMVGLFHNFGFLFLAQLFPPEFKLLSRWLHLQPNATVTALESRLLGMGKAHHILRGGHAKLGAWLLKYWELPEQTWVVAQEHHNQQYQGKYSTYVQIINITNHILRKHKIGDGMPGEISSMELDFLNLKKQELDQIVTQVMSDSNDLEKIASALVY